MNFHVQPKHGSTKTTLASGDAGQLVSTKREGVWFLCHMRKVSGWVHAQEVVPVSFPAVYLVNDELAGEAKIRLRSRYFVVCHV